MSSMATYHLHARLFEGPLDAPTRNVLQTEESDDYASAVELGEALASRGFRVWLYEHGPVKMPNGEGAYRVVREW